MRRFRMGLALILATAAQWLLRGLEAPEEEAEAEEPENPEPDISPGLRLAEDYPADNLVALLEEALEEAKAGTLRGLWGIGLYPDGGYTLSANMGLDIPLLLGHIELAKADLMSRVE